MSSRRGPAGWAASPGWGCASGSRWALRPRPSRKGRPAGRSRPGAAPPMGPSPAPTIAHGNVVRGCYGESGMAVALGLDVGERRIGVARSDGWGLLATPATTLLRTSDREAAAAIGRLAGEAGATGLGVG